MTYAADDHAAIKARLDQIKSERVTAIAGEPPPVDSVYAHNITPEYEVAWSATGYQAPDDFMGYADRILADHLEVSRKLNEAIARLNEANAS